MVLKLIEEDWPLDRVAFYDTGMEFNAIYRNWEKLKEVLDAHDIEHITLHPERPFLYDMLEKLIESKENGKHCGYGWCGGVTRWGTEFKTAAIDKYCKSLGKVVQYVGIAFDEAFRLAAKQAPLFFWRMTEQDCMDFCRSRGWDWDEGGIDLYTILDRVSCWCCANKNLKELENIYTYLPEYWSRLLALQDRIDRPMKRYRDKVHGEYGNLHDLQRVFAEKEVMPNVSTAE